jgi:diguanylate cyclase (GGDEF)-like protein
MKLILIASLFLSLFLLMLNPLSSAQDRREATSSPPAENAEKTTIVVNPNPKPGKVIFYSTSGALEKSGVTRKQYLLKPGRYIIVVIAEETYFSFWKGETERYLTASRSYIVNPPQKKMMRWDHVVQATVLAILCIAGLSVGLSLYCTRIYIARKTLESARLKSGTSTASAAGDDGGGSVRQNKKARKDALQCWQMQQCNDGMRHTCDAIKKKLSCWDTEMTPCCQKDRAFCILCAYYRKRLLDMEMKPVLQKTEKILINEDSTILEKLSNPQMLFLSDLSSILSTQNSPETLGHAFLEKISDALVCEKGVLLLVEKNKEKLTFLSSYNWEAVPALKKSLDFSLLMHKWVIENQFPMNMHQAKKHAYWPKLFPKEYERSLFYEFELICPLLDEKGKTIGIILLGKKRTGSSFLPEEYSLLRLASRMITISLEKIFSYQLATFDGLTNLHVVRFFQERLNEELKSPKAFIHGCSLLMIDVDHFKRFNDAYGHQQGDMVLKEVAEVIIGNLRTNDLAARYGGEEMTVILPFTDKKVALEIAERMRKKVEIRRFTGLPDGAYVTVSVGVASYPLDAQSQEELISKADKALYRAKNSGRNRTSA